MIAKRLVQIAQLITRQGTVVDVGCDHGQLAHFVLDNKIAHKVIACDISPHSLQKVAPKLGIDKRCGYGLRVINEGEGVDTIVIAGLGGLTICEILTDFFQKNTQKPDLILSPQSHASKTRALLSERGYKIVFDTVLRDGKFYDQIKACHDGNTHNLSYLQLHFGVFYKNQNPDLHKKLLQDKARLQKIVPNDKIKTQLQLLEELLLWQQ